VDKFAAGMKRGALVVVASVGLMSGAMAGVIGTGAEFEQTLVSAAAKFPGEIRKGTEAFQQLEAAARKTGATTEFTASQSAAALNFLAMAGFNAESSIAALPGVVDLATAANVDLATATDVASDSLGAFGLMTKDAAQLGANLARVNDVIAKTTTTANTTVQTLFETIKDGAPVATSAGVSLETFAALAGELANSGIKGSKAGTTLKNMFLSLSAPGKQAASILNRLGVQTKDADGNLIDIVDILGSLNKSLDGLGTADRAGILEGIFGKIPIAGVNVLLKSGSERLNEYRKQLEGASGASATMAGVMRDTVQGRINSLKSAVEGVSISIFKMNEGPLAGAIDKMTDWVRVNEDMIATNVGGFFAGIINNFENIVLWVKRIGTALAVFIAFSAALKTLVLVMTAVNLVMAANPITLIVLGIGALIGLIALAVANWDRLKAAFLGLPGPVKAALDFLITPIQRLVMAAGLIMDNWEPIKQFFVDLWDGVIGIFDAAVGRILGIVDTVKGAASFISGAVSSAGSGVAGFFGFGDDEEGQKSGGGSQVVSPQDRVARSIEESRSTSTAEVTIKDETGRAELSGGKLGAGLSLQPSGAF
jgi:TP901 family phage tail tape measure protein